MKTSVNNTREHLKLKRRNVFLILVVVSLLSGLIIFPWISYGTASLLSSSIASLSTTTDDSPKIPSGNSSPKKRESLSRVLSAPFRAVARIFGGGKSKKATSTAGPAPGDSVDAATHPRVTPARGVPALQEQHTVLPAAPRGTQTAVPVPADDVAALATGSETIIAPVPASTPATEYRAPVAWKPVIDGISSDHLAQGRALLESGYVDEAIAELSIAAGIGSNLLEANDLLGRAYSRRGWHKQAMECYERALVAVPNDPLMLAGLGYSLYLNNNQPLALKRLKQAAKRLPNDPSIQNNIGLVQTRLGKFDDAYKSFARAGGEFNARVRIAQILESVGRDKEAVKHFEAALRLQPNAPIALQRLAILYQRTNRRDEAEAVRRTLAKPAEKNAAVTGGGS